MSITNFTSRVLLKLGYKKVETALESQKSQGLQYSEFIMKDVKKVENHTMLSYLKLATLYEQVISLEKNGIKGDYVECGVWKGGSVGMMALANLRFGRERRVLHLFDSFDDICEPNTDLDGQQAIEDLEKLMGKKMPKFSGNLKPIKGVYNSRGGHGTINACKDLIVGQIGYDADKVFFYKGWFQDTLPRGVDNIDKIAILRLDADWYESTKICLEYLYPKVVNGGFVIIDDYGRYEGCKKAVDEFIINNGLKVFLNYSNYKGGECRYFIKY